MKKALIIIVAVAVLGLLAAYINPLKPDASENRLGMVDTPGSASTASSGNSAATTAIKGAYADGIYQGSAYSNPYGEVQVSVTISGGKITTVNFDQLTADESESEEINSHAAPLLKEETLTTQSATIDGVSGASYTSASYVRSVQSALDKAKG